MGPHYGYFIREIRIVAYKQYLQSYSSVKLSSMSESFGVSVEFLDTYAVLAVLASGLLCDAHDARAVCPAVNWPSSSPAVD